MLPTPMEYVKVVLSDAVSDLLALQTRSSLRRRIDFRSPISSLRWKWMFGMDKSLGESRELDRKYRLLDRIRRIEVIYFQHLQLQSHLQNFRESVATTRIQVRVIMQLSHQILMRLPHCTAHKVKLVRGGINLQISLSNKVAKHRNGDANLFELFITPMCHK
jgi:hypothetical protein